MLGDKIGAGPLVLWVNLGHAFTRSFALFFQNKNNCDHNGHCSNLNLLLAKFIWWSVRFTSNKKFV